MCVRTVPVGRSQRHGDYRMRFSSGVSTDRDGGDRPDAVWLGVSVINARSGQLLGSSVEGAVSSEQEVEIHKHVPPVISEKRSILRIAGVVVDLQRVLMVAQVDPGYRKAHCMFGAHVYVF